MPACARSETVEEGVVGTYHCTSRCVRRAFLCGVDRYTGENYDHRKSWVQQRLRELAGIFAIDLHNFAILSNHLHTICRTRPDVVDGWSDEEIAERWWRLFPKRRDKDGNAAEPRDHELLMLRSDPVKPPLFVSG